MLNIGLINLMNGLINMENCKSCSTIGACPFAFNDKSEQVQNYGCLPTPYEIINMRVKYGKTWACHSNPKKPCLGALNSLKEKGLQYKVLDKELITEESNWGLFIK